MKTILKQLSFTDKNTIATLILYKLMDTKGHSVRADELIYHVEMESGHVISGAKLRKIINHLRQSNMPITSSYHGYTYTTEIEDVDKTIANLQQRIDSMQQAIDGLKKSKRIIKADFI